MGERTRIAMWAFLLVMLLALGVSAAYSQLSTSTLTPDCKDTVTIIKEPQFTTRVVTHPNSTKETILDPAGFKDVEVVTTTCNPPKLVINSKEVDYKLQGYACKNTTQGVICDSCVDGNCDGHCAGFDDNTGKVIVEGGAGGETCCKVNDGIVICKNSAKTWTEKSGTLPVEVLR